jgi:hypothetical protein
MKLFKGFQTLDEKEKKQNSYEHGTKVPNSIGRHETWWE